jgi:uncharacterized protein (TIGR03083 family)
MRALRASQARLADTLATIPSEELGRPAYPKEWTVAQVTSHLGSGAETFLLFVKAGLDRTPAPGVEQFQPIWDRWNAKSANDQVQDALAADAALLDTVELLSEREQRTWHLEMFGAERDLSGLLRMRLAEHALHTWDVAVVLDPAAVVPTDAAALTVDHLPMIVQYVAKPTAQLTIRVVTTVPELNLELELAPDGSRLHRGTSAPEDASVLGLPAEAFVRLIYGRLDPEHTPATVHAEPKLLDVLRSTFTGV